MYNAYGIQSFSCPYWQIITTGCEQPKPAFACSEGDVAFIA